MYAWVRSKGDRFRIKRGRVQGFIKLKITVWICKNDHHVSHKSQQLCWSRSGFTYNLESDMLFISLMLTFTFSSCVFRLFRRLPKLLKKKVILKYQRERKRHEKSCQWSFLSVLEIHSHLLQQNNVL